jgi:hypothetical protein
MRLHNVRRLLGPRQQLQQLCSVEIRHPQRACLPCRLGCLERAPRLTPRASRRHAAAQVAPAGGVVQQQQVHTVRVQLAQAVRHPCRRLLVPKVPRVYFGRHEHVFPRQRRRRQRLPDQVLAVPLTSLCAVQQPIAGSQRRAHRLACALPKPSRAEADARHARAAAQRDIFRCVGTCPGRRRRDAAASKHTLSGCALRSCMPARTGASRPSSQ